MMARKSAELREILIDILEDLLPVDIRTSPEEVRKFYMSNILQYALSALVGKTDDGYRMIRGNSDGSLKVALGNLSGLGPSTWMYYYDATYRLDPGLDESVRFYAPKNMSYCLKGYYMVVAAPSEATTGDQQVWICSALQSTWGCWVKHGYNVNVEINRYYPRTSITNVQPDDKGAWAQVIRDIWGDEINPIASTYLNNTNVAQYNRRRHTMLGVKYARSV